jgi:hypothetical protein
MALQVWNSASEVERKAVLRLPPIIPSARAHQAAPDDPAGVIAYLRFPEGTDALVRMGEQGALVSQSLTAAFCAAACAPETPAVPLAENHHDLVTRSVQHAVQEHVTLGGQLGSMRSTRRKVYERLKQYREQLRAQPTLFSDDMLRRLDPALNALFKPLRESASEALGRQLRLGIGLADLADMVIRLHEEGKLSVVTETAEHPEPQIVCSLGLVKT